MCIWTGRLWVNRNLWTCYNCWLCVLLKICSYLNLLNWTKNWMMSFPPPTQLCNSNGELFCFAFFYHFSSNYLFHTWKYVCCFYLPWRLPFNTFIYRDYLFLHITARESVWVPYFLISRICVLWVSNIFT